MRLGHGVQARGEAIHGGRVCVNERRTFVPRHCDRDAQRLACVSSHRRVPWELDAGASERRRRIPPVVHARSRRLLPVLERRRCRIAVVRCVRCGKRPSPNAASAVRIDRVGRSQLVTLDKFVVTESAPSLTMARNVVVNDGLAESVVSGSVSAPRTAEVFSRLPSSLVKGP